MFHRVYCSDDIMRKLYENGCQLNKVLRADGTPVWYTLPRTDENWQNCDAYYIPTLDEVVRWFREYHHLAIVVESTLDNSHMYWINRIDVFHPDSEYCTPNTFETYDEAIESAILVCFQLIKNS